jgi:hypothetical protein
MAAAVIPYNALRSAGLPNDMGVNCFRVMWFYAFVIVQDFSLGWLGEMCKQIVNL